HADAAVGDVLADEIRLVGAMDRELRRGPVEVLEHLGEAAEAQRVRTIDSRVVVRRVERVRDRVEPRRGWSLTGAERDGSLEDERLAVPQLQFALLDENADVDLGGLGGDLIGLDPAR